MHFLVASRLRTARIQRGRSPGPAARMVVPLGYAVAAAAACCAGEVLRRVRRERNLKQERNRFACIPSVFQSVCCSALVFRVCSTLLEFPDLFTEDREVERISGGNALLCITVILGRCNALPDVFCAVDCLPIFNALQGLAWLHRAELRALRRGR